ncbi:hypothetical protein ACP8Y2_22540 [Herpetosiphon llansteffanensis]
MAADRGLYGRWLFQALVAVGWHWEQTEMRDPERIARWWALLAVATLWVVSVGGAADATDPPSAAREDADLPDSAWTLADHRRLITQQPLPVGRFYPEPWSPI